MRAKPPHARRVFMQQRPAHPRTFADASALGVRPGRLSAPYGRGRQPARRSPPRRSHAAELRALVGAVLAHPQQLKRQRKHNGRIVLGPDVRQRLQVAQRNRRGFTVDDGGRLRELLGGD